MVGNLIEVDEADRRRRLFDALTIAAILVGSTLRVAHFWHRGAFWGDEAALGYNLLSRSLLQLARPLDLYQAAPVGFLMLEKLAGSLFGVEENVLRLPALLAGIATLMMSAWSSRSLFGPVVAAVTTLLLALSPDLIRYSGEFKPYTFDAAIAISLFTLFARQPRSDRSRNLGPLAMAGLLAPWFSLPSVFVLAGCGGSLIVRSMVDGDHRSLRLLLSISALWAASFAVEYLLCLRAASAEPELIQYWSGSFAPFPPRSVADLRWYAAKAIYLFEPVVGLPARHLALAVFLIGCGLIWKRNTFAACGMISTVTAVLAASAIHKYPFNGRLILFLMPILVQPIAIGIEKLLSRPLWSRVALGLILLGCLLFQPTKLAANRIADDSRGERTINRNIAMYKTMIEEYRPGDQFVVSHEAAWSFRYYSLRYGFSPTEIIYLGKRPREHWIKQLSKPRHSRTWLFCGSRRNTPESEATRLTEDLPSSVRMIREQTEEVLGFALQCYQALP